MRAGVACLKQANGIMTSTQYRHSATLDGARRAMIDSQLRTSGVNEPWVLRSMASVAREDFVPAGLRHAAYIDRMLPLGDGRMLASPVAHGMMLAEAAPGDKDKVLLIGDGDGYLAALIRPLVASLEARDPAHIAAEPGAGDFDLVLVDGAMEQVPDELAALLADGGRLIGGIVERGVSRLARGRRSGDALAMTPISDAALPRLAAFDKPARWSF